jgi:hypothetical protein
MSQAAAMLIEVQVEARTVATSKVTELRPVPVWCPLPRADEDPRVNCVGWVAGRQTARTDGVLVTTTWCWVDLDTPADLVSRPSDALRLDRLPADAGRLWALSRPRSLEWLTRELETKRRFRTSLDLGAINERRAAAFTGARGQGPRRREPLFGRAWWVPDAASSTRDSTLGALDDRFVLIVRGGESAPELNFVDEAEAKLDKTWRERRN